MNDYLRVSYKARGRCWPTQSLTCSLGTYFQVYPHPSLGRASSPVTGDMRLPIPALWASLQGCSGILQV